jgi:hypothetical protein
MHCGQFSRYSPCQECWHSNTMGVLMTVIHIVQKGVCAVWLTSTTDFLETLRRDQSLTEVEWCSKDAKKWVLCLLCLLSREVKWGDQQGVCQVTSYMSRLLIPAVENIEVGNWKWPIHLKHLASVFASCCMWTKYRCVGAKGKIFLMCNYSGHEY